MPKATNTEFIRRNLRLPSISPIPLGKSRNYCIINTLGNYENYFGETRVSDSSFPLMAKPALPDESDTAKKKPAGDIILLTSRHNSVINGRIHK